MHVAVMRYATEPAIQRTGAIAQAPRLVVDSAGLSRWFGVGSLPKIRSGDPQLFAEIGPLDSPAPRVLQRSPAAASKLSDIDAAFTVLAPSNDAFASAAGLSDALGAKGGPYKVLSRRPCSAAACVPTPPRNCMTFVAAQPRVDAALWMSMTAGEYSVCTPICWAVDATKSPWILRVCCLNLTMPNTTTQAE